MNHIEWGAVASLPNTFLETHPRCTISSLPSLYQVSFFYVSVLLALMSFTFNTVLLQFISYVSSSEHEHCESRNYVFVLVTQRFLRKARCELYGIIRVRVQ